MPGHRQPPSFLPHLRNQPWLEDVSQKRTFNRSWQVLALAERTVCRLQRIPSPFHPVSSCWLYQSALEDTVCSTNHSKLTTSNQLSMHRGWNDDNSLLHCLMENHQTRRQLVQHKRFASQWVEVLLLSLYITANGNNVESLQSLLEERTQRERNKYAAQVQLCLVGL